MITSTHITGDMERMAFMPHHLSRGQCMPIDHLKRLSPDYTGGAWNFYSLADAVGQLSWYMAPQTPERLSINTPSGVIWLSADAAGIAASLHTLRQVATTPDHLGAYDARVIGQYNILRDFAAQHIESDAIFKASDCRDS